MSTFGMHPSLFPIFPMQVELYGRPQIIAGRRNVNIRVPENALMQDITTALAEVCPELVGDVILEDCSGLQSSYIFNLNGTTFLDNEMIHLKPDDTMLLFSSQTGG